ncbi:MAG: hypothetical protein AB7Q81_24600 [Gammaproteobacteria bacterium]
MPSLDDRLYELDFAIQRSIRYHSRRRAFFDRCSSLGDALAVVFSSATVASLLNQTATDLAPWFAAVVTVVAALNLVVGSARMARTHHDLARRFIALEAEIAVVVEPDEANYRRWVAARLAIEAEEPPVLRVLDTICHNDVLRAMGFDPSYAIPVGPVQRRLAHFCDFREHALKQAQYPEPEESPAAVPGAQG